MAVSGALGGGGRELRVDVEQLSTAAGAFETLATELAAHQFFVTRERFGSGNDVLDEAIGGFADSWSGGLSIILDAQSGIAQGLRSTVQEYAGIDQGVQESIRAKHRRIEGHA